MQLAGELKLLFWDVDFEALDVERDAEFILPRVLEQGRLTDIIWLVHRYGFERIHQFLRDRGHVELSVRTITFWRNYFDAKEETWVNPNAWRQNNAASWPS
jgi:Family of unknown function (DUF6922)